MRNVEYRRSLLVKVDGRMVATHLPDERHGQLNTYKYWLCRCQPCTDANRTRAVTTSESDEALFESWRQAFVLDRLSEQARYLVGEYEHMRSFGMCHERACARVGVSRRWMEQLFREAVPA